MYPKFFKHYHAFVKVISENECLEVYPKTDQEHWQFGSDWYNIRGITSKVISEGDEITQAEFIAAWELYKSQFESMAYPQQLQKAS